MGATQRKVQERKLVCGSSRKSWSVGKIVPSSGSMNRPSDWSGGSDTERQGGTLVESNHVVPAYIGLGCCTALRGTAL